MTKKVAYEVHHKLNNSQKSNHSSSADTVQVCGFSFRPVVAVLQVLVS